MCPYNEVIFWDGETLVLLHLQPISLAVLHQGIQELIVCACGINIMVPMQAAPKLEPQQIRVVSLFHGINNEEGLI